MLTNQGSINWNSSYHTFSLQGGGQVENEGLFEVNANGPNWNQESGVCVPMSLTSGATLQVDDNGRLVIGAGSSLETAGTLRIGSGARLRLDNLSPARDLAFLPGCLCLGPGTIQLEGGNRVVLDGDVTLGGGLLNLLGTSSLADGSLDHRERGDGEPRSLSHIPRFPHGSWHADVDRRGRDLRDSGHPHADLRTINNAGGILAGTFINNGGVFNGGAPGHPLALRIIRVALPAAQRQTAPEIAGSVSSVVRSVVLDCVGAPGLRFRVETSIDLHHWRAVTANCQETSPGHFQVSAAVSDADQRFFRLREAAPN